VAVGARHEGSLATGVNGNQADNSGTNCGAAYVFARKGTNWSQQAYLKASNTAAADYFGWSVSVSGDTVVVGASGEASNATGVDGDQSDNSANQSGAAYVFVRSGTNWTQQAYLKASNTDAGDQFSFSVAVSGDTVVVGAYGEASNGVDGDQSNNSAFNAGAAYLFTGLGLGTLLSNVRDGSGGYFIRFNGVPGMTYRLERAPSVAGPWDTIDTQIAPASGLIEYHETSPPPGKAFYRTAQP